MRSRIVREVRPHDGQRGQAPTRRSHATVRQRPGQLRPGRCVGPIDDGAGHRTTGRHGETADDGWSGSPGSHPREQGDRLSLAPRVQGPGQERAWQRSRRPSHTTGVAGHARTTRSLSGSPREGTATLTPRNGRHRMQRITAEPRSSAAAWRSIGAMGQPARGRPISECPASDPRSWPWICQPHGTSSPRSSLDDRGVISALVACVATNAPRLARLDHRSTRRGPRRLQMAWPATIPKSGSLHPPAGRAVNALGWVRDRPIPTHPVLNRTRHNDPDTPCDRPIPTHRYRRPRDRPVATQRDHRHARPSIDPIRRRGPARGGAAVAHSRQGPSGGPTPGRHPTHRTRRPWPGRARQSHERPSHRQATARPATIPDPISSRVDHTPVTARILDPLRSYLSP